MKYITLLLDAIKQIFSYLNFNNIKNAGKFEQENKQLKATILLLKKDNKEKDEEIAFLKRYGANSDKYKRMYESARRKGILDKPKQ